MDVEKMSDNELRSRLMELGQDNVPPITDTTRKLLRRKLQKLLTAAPVSATRSTSTKSLPAQPVARETVTTRIATRFTASTASPTKSSSSVDSAEIIKKPTRTVVFSSDEEDTGGSSFDGRSKRFSPKPKSESRPSYLGAFKPESDGSGSSSLTSRFSGFNLFSRKAPATSTPIERRAGVRFTDNSPNVTPIRDDQFARRSLLARPSLAEYGTGSSSTPAPKGEQRKSFFSRLVDPIHLTPMNRGDKPVRHLTPHPRTIRIKDQSQIEEKSDGTKWISWALILAVLVFFAGVGVTYWWMKWNTPDIDTSLMRFQLADRSPDDVLHQCADIEKGIEPIRQLGQPCYNEEEIVVALSMGSALAKELAYRKGAYECGDSNKFNADVVDARSFAIEAVPGSTVLDFGRAVDLIVANPHWGIRALDGEGNPARTTAEVRTFESDYARKSWACRMKETLASALFRIAMGILGIVTLIALGFGIRNYITFRQQHQAQVFDMVGKIIDTVKRAYEKHEQGKSESSHVIIAHLRENFVPHGRQRKELLTIWNEAVKYITAHESRIATESALVNGEEFAAFRWLPTNLPSQVDSPLAESKEIETQTSPKTMDSRPVVPDSRTGVEWGNEQQGGRRSRMWNGSGGRTSELVSAATPCLKVRGFFDGRNESQSDLSWTEDVKEAILEKCHGVANITDMRVETPSEEGVVYVKLASNEDARNAYLAMHGQIFDGRSLNVKFLKLDRYHQRFPEAVGRNAALVAKKFKIRNK